MTSSGDASYQVVDNVCTMRFERTFAQPVDRVWAALTEPDDLKAWFYPFVGTLAAGESVVIPWDDAGGLTSMVVEFDPPKVFAWTWHKPGEPESIVRWELTPEDAGTRLVLTHSLTALGPNEPTDTLAGWQEHLDTLVDHLAGYTRPWSAERWRTLKDRYAIELAQPLLASPYGVVESVNGRPQVRFARMLDATLERVWEAISTSAGVSGWFTTADVDLHQGGSYTLDFTQFSDKVYVHPILGFEAPRWVEFPFGDSDDDVVRWELFANGEQTLFILTNRLGADTKSVGLLGGWHYHLDRLPTFLAGEPDNRPGDHIPQLEAHYQRVAGQ